MTRENEEECESGNDRFRWCIYCGVDCYLDDPEHADSCPQVTGVYPVTEKDAATCRHCGVSEVDMLCKGCGQQFKVGDVYVLVGGDEPTGVPGLEGARFAGVVTCIGCAAIAEVSQ